jgi:hypothetical protein
VFLPLDTRRVCSEISSLRHVPQLPGKLLLDDCAESQTLWSKDRFVDVLVDFCLHTYCGISKFFTPGKRLTAGVCHPRTSITLKDVVDNFDLPEFAGSGQWQGFTLVAANVPVHTNAIEPNRALSSFCDAVGLRHDLYELVSHSRLLPQERHCVPCFFCEIERLWWGRVRVACRLVFSL